MSRINMDLIDQVMRHIEFHQDLWDQSTWGRAMFDSAVLDEIGVEQARKIIMEDPTNPACGSSFCFAGHVAYTVDRKKPYISKHSVWWENFRGTADLSFVKTGPDENDYVDVGAYARDRLNLDNSETAILFDGNNTLHDLRGMVEYMREHDCLPSDWRRAEHECNCDFCGVEYED